MKSEKNVISVNFRVWRQNNFLKTANFKTCQLKFVLLSLALQSDWTRDTLSHTHLILSPLPLPEKKNRITFCSICAFFLQETGWGHTLKGQNQNLTYSIAILQLLGDFDSGTFQYSDNGGKGHFNKILTMIFNLVPCPYTWVRKS